MTSNSNCPKIAVVIPVYNSIPFLSRAIESYQNQNYSNLMIILVDNGSKDGSVEIIREYAKNDSRIHVIEREVGSGSPAKPREDGAKFAIEQKVDFITFLDADDFVENDHITNLMRVPNAKNQDLIFCGYKKVYRDHEYIPQKGVKLGKIEGKEKIVRVAFGEKRNLQNWSCCWQILFSTKTIKAISEDEWRWIETINLEDSALTLLAALNSEKAYDSGNVSINYTQNDSSELNGLYVGKPKEYTPQETTMRFQRVSGEEKLKQYALRAKEKGVNLDNFFISVFKTMAISGIIHSLLNSSIHEWDGNIKFIRSHRIEILKDKEIAFIYKMAAIATLLSFKILCPLSKILLLSSKVEKHSKTDLNQT